MALIAHAASYGNPQPGSFIPCILRLSEALEARGDQLAFITTRIPEATWETDVRNSVSQLHLVSNPAEVCAILGRIRPAIIHTHFYEFDVPITLGMFFSDARIFWHEHSMRDEKGFAAGAKFYLKYHWVGRRVEGFVGVSEAVGSDLRGWGAPANKVKVIVNGIDTHWFRPPTPPERVSARRELELNSEETLLIFGRDTRGKGVDIFSNALKFLDKPTVVLVGAPAEAQREVSLAAGRLININSTKDVRKLYWAADVLAFPSRQEGLPFVLVEALACGLPAVISDLGATREIAKDLDATWLVPAGDPFALAAAIKQIKHQCVDRTAQMQRFTLERWASEILDLYDEGSSDHKLS